MKTLFPHQIAGVESALMAQNDGLQQILEVMAVGSGKTLMAAYLARILCPPEGNRRVLWLCHREELALQALAAFQEYYPADHIGLMQADNNQPYNQVTVGLVQTLRNEHRLQQVLRYGKPHLIVEDEAHHAIARSFSTTAATAMTPQTLKLGITATPGRGDGRSIRPEFPDGIVYTKSMLDLMVEVNPQTGSPYLVDLLPPITITTDVRVAGVKHTGAEFNHFELGQAIDASLDRYTKAFAAYKRFLAPERRKTLIFAHDRRDAYKFKDRFEAEGVPTAVVLGNTSWEERKRINGNPYLGVPGAFEQGEYDVLVGVGVFLEGTDMPFVSAAIDGRIPQSPWLLTQMVGRVLRAHQTEHWIKRNAMWVSLAPCDHSLITPTEMVGSEKPLTVSVRQFVEEKVKDAPVEDPAWEQFDVQEGRYHLTARTRQPFKVERPVGTWSKNVATQDLQLVTRTGLYTLERVGTDYSVRHTSPGGQIRHLVKSPISRHLATAYAEYDASQKQQRKAHLEDPRFLSGPVSQETFDLATKRMRLKNVKQTMTERQVQAIISAVKPSLKRSAPAKQLRASAI